VAVVDCAGGCIVATGNQAIGIVIAIRGCGAVHGHAGTVAALAGVCVVSAGATAWNAKVVGKCIAANGGCRKTTGLVVGIVFGLA
jgi:hypothetical protein